MVTGRTLLVYNFGIAAIFIAMALFSAFALEPLMRRSVLQPPFDAASHEAIQKETDLERLRNRAAFYFEVARGLKESRYADTSLFFSDVRKICFALGIAFAIGGGLTVLALRSGPPK